MMLSLCIAALVLVRAHPATAAPPTSHCHAEREWPTTEAGWDAILGCAEGEAGERSRKCLDGGVWDEKEDNGCFRAAFSCGCDPAFSRCLQAHAGRCGTPCASERYFCERECRKRTGGAAWCTYDNGWDRTRAGSVATRPCHEDGAPPSTTAGLRVRACSAKGEWEAETSSCTTTVPPLLAAPP